MKLLPVYRNQSYVYIELLKFYYPDREDSNICAPKSFRDLCFRRKDMDKTILKYIEQIKLKSPRVYCGEKNKISIFLCLHVKDGDRKRISSCKIKKILDSVDCFEKVNYSKREYLENYFDKLTKEYIIIPDELFHEIPLHLSYSLYNKWYQCFSEFSIDILYLLKNGVWIY